MKLILIAILLIIAKGDNFQYGRILDCVANNTKKCTKWKESTILTYQSTFSYFCFSENTFVQTKQGPKTMKSLKIQDEILSYDPLTGKQTYSPIVAWLHRDTQAIVNYDLIKTNEGTSFQASNYHNIAFVDKDGKIDFKFAKDLSPGDELIGSPNGDPKVSSVESEGQRQGLYSPFTEVGNYFIFNSAFDNQTDPKTAPMILANVLSQVANPNSELKVAKAFINLWETFNLNNQPSDEERYTHPLLSTYSFLFGLNWIHAQQAVKYQITHDQSSSSSSYVSSIFSSSSTSCYGSSSYSCEQNRRDKMKALGLSVSVIQEVVLF